MKYIMPLILTFVISFSFLKRKRVYEDFTDGVCDGFLILKSIIGPVIAVMVSVEMLRVSGAFDMLLKIIEPLFLRLNLYPEILPLAIIRPLSGSGATGVLTDILKNYGPDSKIGMSASVISGATETTFYCLAVYFSRTRVKNSIKAAVPSVIGDITGIIVGTILIKLFKF